MIIDIQKDDELIENIKRVKSIYDVYGVISVEVGGENPLGLDRFAIFITHFFKTCIHVALRDELNSTTRFSLEGPYELRFDSQDSHVVIGLYRRNEVTPEAEFEVAKDEFVSEICRASEEYLSFVLNHRPEFEGRSGAIEYRKQITGLKEQHNQTDE